MTPTSVLLIALLNRELSKTLTFKQRLNSEGRRRRDRRINRSALLLPSKSPFIYVLNSMSDQSMITLTGIDHVTFVYLLTLFEPLYYRYTPHARNGDIGLRFSKSGRPRSMTAEMCLGLVLSWHRTRGAMWNWCLLFGVTNSVCSMFLRFWRRLLLRVLSREKHATIRMPNLVQVQEFKEAISEKYHKLDSVYAIVDGLKLLLEQSGDCVIQNMFYNGWTHDHYVGNVFVFAPNETIIACLLNAPGSMHDSVIADLGKLCNKLGAKYAEHGGLCLVDSAFCKKNHPFLLKSAQDETNVTDPDDLVRLRQAASVRQASEWGMRAFRGMFPRMKDRFMYEENGERRIMLLFTAHLFYLRTRKAGINQILSTYMPQKSADVNYYLQDTFNLY